MAKTRGKRVPTSLSIDADDIFILEKIAENRSIKLNVLLREILKQYAEKNDPYPAQMKEILRREQSDRARQEYPEKFAKGGL